MSNFTRKWFWGSLLGILVLTLQVVMLLQILSLKETATTLHDMMLKMDGNATVVVMESKDGIVAKKTELLELIEQGFPKDLVKAWNEIKLTTAKYFEETAVIDIHLPLCNLDKFFKNILADDAPMSIAKYQMDKIGDTELKTSQWQLEKGGFISSRTIQYIHPVNNPLAPPSARATKRQNYHRYGSNGFVIDTVTEVLDVPKTDCFVVEDRIIVERSKKAGGVKLSARFKLRFVKKTMFKAIITKQTTAEFKDWFQGFGQMATEVCDPAAAASCNSTSFKSDNKGVKERFRFPW